MSPDRRSLIEPPGRAYSLVGISAGDAGQGLGFRLFVLALVSVATACSATGPPLMSDDRQMAGSTASSAQGSTGGVSGTEMRAGSDTLEVWALLYEPPPWKAGQEVKVVWRATGTGSFAVTAVGPDSQRVAPIAGPYGTPRIELGATGRRVGEFLPARRTWRVGVGGVARKRHGVPAHHRHARIAILCVTAHVGLPGQATWP